MVDMHGSSTQANGEQGAAASSSVISGANREISFSFSAGPDVTTTVSHGKKAKFEEDGWNGCLFQRGIKKLGGS